MDNTSIKAVIFDSGRVLNQPVTGHWFITPNFYSFVEKEKLNLIHANRKRNAFKKEGKYIAAQNRIDTEREEYIHFLEYYKLFFYELPELNMDDKQIELVTKDLVFNYEKYKFFGDVYYVIPRLSESYKLAVVSDAWPSLESVFNKAGLRDYFKSFIISSKLGVTKPD